MNNTEKLQEDVCASVEHVTNTFDPEEYRGPSTCGFAHIHRIDGRSAFVRNFKKIADEDRNGGYNFECSGLRLSLRKAYDSGYRLSVGNLGNLLAGPEIQRMDFREDVHQMLLDRLQQNGYLEDAYVSSRMD